MANQKKKRGPPPKGSRSTPQRTSPAFVTPMAAQVVKTARAGPRRLLIFVSGVFNDDIHTLANRIEHDPSLSPLELPHHLRHLVLVRHVAYAVVRPLP